MKEDMDVNCGPILEGSIDIDEMGRVIFDLILDTASGRKTKSENFGFGANEFVPWHIGAVM
jgi:altronate hydrolase